MCSDVGTEVVVETGLAFDFGPMASSIRWLLFDSWRDRGSTAPTTRRMGTQTPQHDVAMAAPTPRRMAPTTPQHDAARRKPRIESSIIYYILYVIYYILYIIYIPELATED